MNKNFNHFNRYVDERKKWLKWKGREEWNDLLLDLKNEQFNNLEIQYFNGTKDFGESFPSLNYELEDKKKYVDERKKIRKDEKMDEVRRMAMLSFLWESKKFENNPNIIDDEYMGTEDGGLDQNHFP